MSIRYSFRLELDGQLGRKVAQDDESDDQCQHDPDRSVDLIPQFRHCPFLRDWVVRVYRVGLVSGNEGPESIEKFAVDICRGRLEVRRKAREVKDAALEPGLVLLVVTRHAHYA